ncbi:MAG: zinc transporter ZupT [Candidatus Aphodosoma sp.]
METTQILLALGLTLIAGLSTGIGGTIAFLTKRENIRFLTISLGFSAGVMLFVSFVDIFPTATELFSEQFSDNALMATVIAFFCGMALIAIIDFLIPENDNPHEIHELKDSPTQSKFHKMGILLALSIAIHNFPEGLATFAVSLKGVDVALPMVLAIALHNIPEGTTIAIPIYQATGSRKKAMFYAFLSGLAEPLGAIIGFLILLPFWNSTIEASLLALTAGIMVYISMDELLPTSERYGQHHLSIMGVVLGMAIMAVSLILL